MSTVNRSNFIKDLDRTGINVNDMDAKTQEALKKANISQKDLMDIAGEDGQIRGAKEYSELFNRVVRHDSSSLSLPDMRTLKS
ncbi:hypothetical protein L0244_40630 [bacterium]|nr:hypothetical protein [bacterium]